MAHRPWPPLERLLPLPFDERAVTLVAAAATALAAVAALALVAATAGVITPVSLLAHSLTLRPPPASTASTVVIYATAHRRSRSFLLALDGRGRSFPLPRARAEQHEAGGDVEAT